MLFIKFWRWYILPYFLENLFSEIFGEKYLLENFYFMKVVNKEKFFIAKMIEDNNQKRDWILNIQIIF